MKPNRTSHRSTEQTATDEPTRRSSGQRVGRRTFLRAAGSGAVLATLAGCTGGGSSDDATTTAAEETTTAAAETTTAAEATETTEATDEESTETTAQPESITVTDYYGREVEVPYPVESIATLNPHVYWAARVLDVQDRFVAATGGETEAYPTISEAPDVGWYREPNVEKIAELSPDLLVTHWRGRNSKQKLDELQEKLSEFDVAVVGIEIAGMELENMKLFAKMVGKEGGLDPFFEWREEKLSMVKEGVSDISDDEKVTVYFEADSGAWTLKHDMPLSVAGGYNVMLELASEKEMKRRREVKADQEKLISLDPDFVLLEDTPGPPRVTGYSATEEGPASKMLDEFLKRPGADMLSAVQNDRTHVVDYKLMSAEKSWLGALYLAKLFYPDRFPDLDPAAVHEEYYTKWLGTDFQGTYLYPSLE